MGGTGQCGGGGARAGDVEVDDGVVDPGEFCDVAVLDPVAGGEDGVQRVSCGVSGVVDELGESDVHVVKEVGGVGVVVVVEVKVDVPEEYLVTGVYGEVGDEVTEA